MAVSGATTTRSARTMLLRSARPRPSRPSWAVVFAVVAILSWCRVSCVLGDAVRCERVALPLCQDVGYNLTAMPNLMGNDDQMQADRALQAYLPLVRYNCTRHLRIFLCSLFAPLCTPHVAEPVPPCRNLCLEVQQDCQPIMETFNFPWPALLNCSRFPVHGDRGLCMQVPASEPPAPVPVAPVVDVTPWTPPPTTDTCPTHFTRTRAPGGGGVACAPRCGQDAYYRREDKHFAETWTTGWAWLCFLSTLFTLLTFWVEPGRFQYPERPVIFLALCYNLLALTHILRGALGADAFSCVAPSDGGVAYLAVDALDSGPCTLSFLALYYFGLASSVWWVVLSASWFLSASKKWSREALHGVSTYFHVAAWFGPAALGVAALAMRKVAGEELTGLCQVSEEAAVWLVVLPHGVLLVAGCVLAALSGCALAAVRRAMRAAGQDAGKLERLMTRLAVFAALYALPVIGALACLLYEAWHRPRWRSLALLAALDCRVAPGCLPGPSYQTAGVEVALLRLFLSLVVGVTSGMWVWSGKTCRAWSRLFSAAATPRGKPRPPMGAGHRLTATAPLHVSRV